MIRSLVLAAAFALSPLANAQYVVSTLGDSGAGSLRQAILDANANLGDETITFAVSGTVTLTTGELVITDTVVINGPGARALTIDGNLGGRIFRIDSTTRSVLLSGMTLTRGLTNGNGGAILNNGGNLNLSFVRITDNQTGADGGAIYDPFQPDIDGQSVNFLIIENSEISINRANKSAGIFHSGFELRIFNSTIHDNVAADSVGGIHEQGGFATIRNSTISGNNANFVGGVLMEGVSMTFESTLFADNADSSGANDINRLSGTVNATNSLFEEDVSAAPAVINGTSTDNLIAVESQVPLALSNNGGPTNSLRPPSTSPAVGAGSNVTTFLFDQRGAGYPRDAGGAVDIGAIQSFLAPPPPSVPVPALAPVALGALSLLLGWLGMRRRR